MSKTNFVEASGNFSLYGVVRFATYIISAAGMYVENFQIAAVAFGFGATLGFIRRLSRIWEQMMEFNIWLVSTIIVTITIAVVILKKRSK